MMPSLLVCIILTWLIVWAAWLLLPRGWAQLMIIGLAGAVWLFQTVRWSYRVFGYTYRLTTRRLFATKGILLTRFEVVHLSDVAQVQVKCVGHGRATNVGKIVVRVNDAAQKPLVLDGVRYPERVAERIREQVQKAREVHIIQARVPAV
jgi:hypothetical protein